uniref:Uncharacterized protein n=1 Tax=Picea sitchensis TaxID=3332 RepID=A0A6B9XU04_PICSI|nr:hypothetical protein Q903MT_gene5603 [Picea sitchensis]
MIPQPTFLPDPKLPYPEALLLNCFIPRLSFHKQFPISNYVCSNGPNLNKA